MQSDSGFVLRGVTLHRGGATVLEDVSAEIPAAACTAFVGRSGAGKSTLLRLLTRLDDLSSGHITFHGIPLETYDVLDLRRRVQLVAQHPVLLTDSIGDEIRLARPHLDGAGIRMLLAHVGLPSSFAERRTEGLSGGEAQRVCLARALALDPEVLLLDEPTAALDAVSAAAIDEAVRALVARGGTVVLVTHNTAQVQRVAHRVIRLEHGRVIAGGSADTGTFPGAAS